METVGVVALRAVLREKPLVEVFVATVAGTTYRDISHVALGTGRVVMAASERKTSDVVVEAAAGLTVMQLTPALWSVAVTAVEAGGDARIMPFLLGLTGRCGLSHGDQGQASDQTR